MNNYISWLEIYIKPVVLNPELFQEIDDFQLMQKQKSII